MKMAEDGDRGSTIEARIFDFKAIGLPYLFDAFALLFSRFCKAALGTKC